MSRSSLRQLFGLAPQSSRQARRRSLFLPVLVRLEDRITPSNVLYTSDADFDRGTVLNLNHDAPNNNQLQLNRATAPLPFVNIAASARGTAIRINSNTGVILGEYQ